MSSAAGKRFNSAVILTLFPRDLKPGLCGSDTTLGTLAYIIRCTAVPDRELCRKNASDDWRGHINRRRILLCFIFARPTQHSGAAAHCGQPSKPEAGPPAQVATGRGRPLPRGRKGLSRPGRAEGGPHAGVARRRRRRCMKPAPGPAGGPCESGARAEREVRGRRVRGGRGRGGTVLRRRGLRVSPLRQQALSQRLSSNKACCYWFGTRAPWFEPDKCPPLRPAGETSTPGPAGAHCPAAQASPRTRRRAGPRRAHMPQSAPADRSAVPEDRCGRLTAAPDEPSARRLQARVRARPALQAGKLPA